MKYPKISIVIPSYNKVRFIGRTLESIFKQKYPNIEVIIQDGGSTDGTLAVIKKYLRKYPKMIKFQTKKDKGQLDAINSGMKKATGDMLTYINADDIYMPGAFDLLAKAYLDNPNALWFAGRGKVINSSGKEIVKLATWYKDFLLTLNSGFFLLITNYLMQPSVFFTPKAWKKSGPFTGTPDFVTEYEFWLKLAHFRMPVIINKYLSGFRIEPKTITKTMSNKLLFEDLRIVKKHTKNSVILFLHKLNNLVRILIVKLI